MTAVGFCGPRRPAVGADAIRRDVDAAGRWLADRLSELDVPFGVPAVSCSRLLLPSPNTGPATDGSDNSPDETPLAE